VWDSGFGIREFVRLAHHLLFPTAMTEFFVNDVPGQIGTSPQTWGDLLVTLDEEVGRTGLLLTAARFDGVDEPSFRDVEVTARRLSDVRRVDVETATPSAFLRQCLQETIGPLTHAAEATTALSIRYRSFDLAGCHQGLIQLATELRGLTTLVATLGVLQIDLGSFTPEGISAADQLERFGAALDSVVTAQESEDWLTVADVLEYDLEPEIRRWIDLFTAIANRL
jgi:hypothetical protein